MNEIDELRNVVEKWQPWGEEDDCGGAIQPLGDHASDRTMLLGALLTMCVFLAAMIASGLTPLR